MEIKTRDFGTSKILDLKGRIVLGQNTIDLRKAIREISVDKPVRIVLNLADVSYIDSAGIGELVSGHTHVTGYGGKMALLNLSKKSKDLIVITKLHTVFSVFDDEQEALKV